MVLNNSDLDLGVIKQKFTEIKEYLEDQNYIKIFFKLRNLLYMR